MSEGTKWKCAICGKGGFKAERYVKTHMKLKHKAELEKMGNVPPDPVVDDGEAAPAAPAVPARKAPQKTTATKPVAPEEAEKAPEKTEEVPAEPEVPSTENVSSTVPTSTPVEVTPPLEGNQTITAPAADPIPDAPPPPEVPPAVILTVPVGSALILNGPTWWQNPQTASWQAVDVEDLTVQVLQKEVVQGDVMLICRAEGGEALWAVQEKQVLAGHVRVLKLSPVEPSMGALGFKPDDGERDIDEPEYDYFEEQRLQEEQAQLRVKYCEDLQRYAAARDAQAEYKKAFEEVQKELRAPLMAYVKEHGVESEPGKPSKYLEDGGFAAQVVVSVGDTVIKRDEARIVEWLTANGFDDCLRLVLDVPKWNALKGEVNTQGQRLVPAEFIREVEQPRKEDDRERLLVNRLAE